MGEMVTYREQRRHQRGLPGGARRRRSGARRHRDPGVVGPRRRTSPRSPTGSPRPASSPSRPTSTTAQTTSEPDEAGRLLMGLAMDQAAQGHRRRGRLPRRTAPRSPATRSAPSGFCTGGSLALWSATLSERIVARSASTRSLPWERMRPQWSNYAGKAALDPLLRGGRHLRPPPASRPRRGGDRGGRRHGRDPRLPGHRARVLQRRPARGLRQPGRRDAPGPARSSSSATALTA